MKTLRDLATPLVTGRVESIIVRDGAREPARSVE
jgi:hypothetical protein